MNIKFRITNTTNFPEFRIDDIMKNLGVEPTVVVCNGKEFSVDEVKAMPYMQEKQNPMMYCHGVLNHLSDGRFFLSHLCGGKHTKQSDNLTMSV